MITNTYDSETNWLPELLVKGKRKKNGRRCSVDVG